MTQTLTTEQLHDYCKYFPQTDPLRMAAEELLENREAVPAAWRYRTTDINGNPNPHWSFSEEASLLGLYQPLYTAPPAPAVPEEITAPLGAIANGYQLSIAQAEGYRWGWNACRAAMLDGVKS